jgi:hypothetical protein
MDSVSTDDGLAQLGFAPAVIQAFAFLHNFEFRQLDASPTLVRYANGRVGANVYLGRSSFEIGFEVLFENERFPLPALIRVADPLAPARIATSLQRLRRPCESA